MIAAMRNNRCHRVLHPIRHAMRAQVIQQQDFGIQRHAVRFLVRRVGVGIVAGTDTIQKTFVVAESAFEALVDDGAQRSDSEVGFASAGGANQ